MKYACIAIITNKHFGEIEKKHFTPKLQLIVCMTLDWVQHSLVSYESFITMLVRSIFFIYLIFLLLVFAYI